MEKTYLVQRLTKPRGGTNPFSFGGGLVNGGLSDEGAELISKVWDFDYMGAAEFELGAIPKTLQRIAQYSSEGSVVTGEVPLGKDILYLCEKDMKSGVERVIQKIADDTLRLKEPAFLKEVIEWNDKSEGNDGFEPMYKGWLELNNGFAFFIDQEMYNNTLKLFGIKE